MADQETYRLTQRAPGGDPGFELFKAKDDGLYYFHFNDEQGEAVLFSKGYATAKARTATCNALRKRMAVESSYIKKGQKESFYFVVADKQDEVLARSKSFATKKSRDALIEQLVRASSPQKKRSQKAQSPPPKSRGPRPQAVRPLPSPAPRPSAQPARYRFMIFFRKVADAAPLSGEIQFPISEEKATFQGVDVDAILQFIIQQLPAGTVAFSRERQQEIDALKAELRQTKRALEKEKAARPRAAVPPAPEPAAAEVAEDTEKAPAPAENPLARQLQTVLLKEQAKVSKPLTLIVEGQVTDNLNWTKGRLPVELLLEIEEPAAQRALEFYRAIFQIKSLDSGRVQRSITFSGQLGPRHRIRVAGNSLNDCAPGPYRLSMRLFPVDPSAVPDYELRGSSVIFIRAEPGAKTPG